MKDAAATQMQVPLIPFDLRYLLAQDKALEEKLLQQGYSLFDSQGQLISRPSTVVICSVCRDEGRGCAGCRLPTHEIAQGIEFKRQLGDFVFSKKPIKAHAHGKILARVVCVPGQRIGSRNQHRERERSGRDQRCRASAPGARFPAEAFVAQARGREGFSQEANNREEQGRSARELN